MAPKSPWKNNHTKASAQPAAATGLATTAINYGEAQDEVGAPRDPSRLDAADNA